MLQQSPQDQNNLLKSRFQDSMAISRLDKEQRKCNQVYANDNHDYHEIVVQNDTKKSKMFVVKQADHQNIEKDIKNQIANNQTNVDDHTQTITQSKLEGHIQSDSKLQKKEGMLMKKSPHFVQGWQDRFCILDRGVLKYYLPNERNKPFGTLNFDLVSYEMEFLNDKKGVMEQFSLKPHQSKKVFTFKGSSTQETDDWFKLLCNHIQISHGASLITNGIGQYFRYWRTDRITGDQFIDQASTGDVLLFRGNSANCQLQRTFTRSEYDHVAVLLKYNEHSLYILEATGYYGVGIGPWSDMIDNEWYNLYEKVIYRKLNTIRDPTFFKKVENFVNENIGKKYSCAPQKLLKQKSTISQAHKAQDVKEERTFFCSELVAALYKECDMLPSEVSAGQYWPGSFSSEKKELILKNGASLGPELLIDFTKQPSQNANQAQ